MISSNTPLLSRPWCAHKKTNTTPILNPPPIEDDRFSQMVDHEYPQSDGTPRKADTFTILDPNGVIWRQIGTPQPKLHSAAETSQSKISNSIANHPLFLLCGFNRNF